MKVFRLENRRQEGLLVLGGLCLLAGLVLWRLWSNWHVSERVVIPSADIHVAGQRRTYRLVVPRSPPPAMPIVFAFHGIGDSPEGMAEYSQLDTLAAQHGFLLVYPKSRGQMWQTSGQSAANASENSDIDFFDAILEQLSQRYEIDDRRVCVVGMSNGASFAQLLAAHRSEKIAAVAGHSGTLPRDALEVLPKRRVPMLLLVGLHESPATIQAFRDEAARYRQRGHVVKLLEVRGLGHQWDRRQNEGIWHFLSGHALP